MSSDISDVYKARKKALVLTNKFVVYQTTFGQSPTNSDQRKRRGNNTSAHAVATLPGAPIVMPDSSVPYPLPKNRCRSRFRKTVSVPAVYAVAARDCVWQ